MKNFCIILLLVVAIITFIPLNRQVSGASLDDIILKIQNVYHETRDLTADFIQESTLRSIDRTQTARGKIYFKNPGKLRWDYKSPAKQEIVTDGKTLWMYLPEDNQVIMNELSKVYRSSTSTFFLMGMGNLKRDFHIELLPSPSEEGENDYSLKLVPNEQQSNFDELFLSVDKSNFLVTEIYFNDFYGNFIRIKFKNISVNKGLPDSLFLFHIPEGVDIVKPPGSLQISNQ